LGICNPTLYPVPFIIWTNASYRSWPGRGGNRDSNGATGGGHRGTDSRLRVRRSNLLHITGRIQQLLHNALWDADWELRDARDELAEMREEVETTVQERVQDRTADLEWELERARARGRLAIGNDVLRKRVWELEAEVTRLKGE
jgi:hypothetical protein